MDNGRKPYEHKYLYWGGIRDSEISNEINAIDQSFESAAIPNFAKTLANTATASQSLIASLASSKEIINSDSASESDNLSGPGMKIDSVISSDERMRKIVAAVQKSNDFHMDHTTALERIEDMLDDL
jgi:hypothetical protein